MLHCYMFRLYSKAIFRPNTRVLTYTESVHWIARFYHSGFGGLEVACWPLVPKFAGSHPAETVGFLGQKNPQHAFLRKGSKAIGPMS